MADTTGEISVIVYVHNEKEQLYRTVLSILRQKSVNLEIVIVDDASEDGCAEFMQDKLADYENIIYIVNDAYQGLASSINSGVCAASSPLLAFAVAGTLWRPEKLKTQRAALTDNDLSWCYCTAQYKDQKENLFIPPASWPQYKTAGNVLPDLLMNIFINMNTVLMNRDVFHEIGGLDPDLPELCEYEFLLRLAASGKAAFRKNILAEVNGTDKNPDGVIIAECYILGEFSKELSQYSLKKEKTLQVIEMSEKHTRLPLFWEYAEYLGEDTEYNVILEEYKNKLNPVRVIKRSTREDVTGVCNCIGCANCVEACPVGAVSMKESADGFLYPSIDEDKCIHCGKCLSKCPTQLDLPCTANPRTCYAVQLGEAARAGSSSGGVFPALAYAVLNQGGYVAGAVFDSDWKVKHIVSNRPEDIEEMRSSKYVQSDISGVYPEIEKLLKQEKTVLFTGCTCQTAALSAFLGKEYDNLYLLDVVCHGVPSPKIFREYLQEFISKYGKIEEIKFRNKQIFGWQPGLYIKFADGREYAGKNTDMFLYGFLCNWYLRENCYECEFKSSKYSDITIGDFWGVQNVLPGVEDGNGTSFMTINTKKGVLLYQMIKDEIYRIESCLTDSAVPYNPCIVRPSLKNKDRELFFQNTKGKTLTEKIFNTYASIHFDIGLVLWWSPNYGNALTNFALYKTLSKKYNVLAFDNEYLYPPGRFKRFAKDYYNLSSDYFLTGSTHLLQNSCDTFIVGSDQAWNVFFERQFDCGKYYQLDFVEDKKRKLSYGASFGMRGAEPPVDYAADYKRFHRISVREAFGVDICREQYGVDAEHVLDPVFLLNAEEYGAVADNSKLQEDEPFIMAYLLNPTPEKRTACKKIKELLGGIKIINVSENSSETRDLYRHVLEFDNVQGDIEVEDWLYYMKNCQYVITDSFHGTCFSVIFQKPYIAFVNRQPDRFQVFDKFSGASDRIFKPGEEIDYEKMTENLDYQTIGSQLEQEKQKSLAWLEEAVNCPIE